jgi:hypothetical protein
MLKDKLDVTSSNKFESRQNSTIYKSGQQVMENCLSPEVKLRKTIFLQQVIICSTKEISN